ncbi:hypothetical protein QAD02_001586 [Eretmocerus hayati]|uniref:Uncharacterized protein n=1 Tax=Eretmocerus hayati TaxID=131215 RepID=A0ACC2NGV2_9HYME|nr:hypothetical protein QAD02_001586 [Eretmocerus hayati]
MCTSAGRREGVRCGDIDDCVVSPVAQGQFTPLPEALCCAILELTSQRQAATLDTLRSALRSTFPAMQRPSRDLVYDALAKLMQERKIYHTAQGYFVVTPETRRLRRADSSSRGDGNGGGHHGHGRRSSRQAEGSSGGRSRAGMLMSNDEAVALVHGEMITLRDGDVTHQAVQTNLADVICGGNPNDKVLFARCRSVPARLERRHSLRLWGSARRLHRSGSSRSLPRRPERSDTSSSAEYASTDSASHSPTKKVGLLSRLFRRSTRRKGATLMGTFSAQYPPTEWFNPRVVHLHNVATQTRAASPSMMEGLEQASQSQSSFQAWDGDSSYSVRSATLPRRQHHRREPSVDSASLLANSTPRSTRRNRSPCTSSSTLPRSKCSSLSRCTSRASVLPPAPPAPPSNASTAATALCNGKSSANSSPSRSGGSSASVRNGTNVGNPGVGSPVRGQASVSGMTTSNGLARLHSSRHSSRRSAANGHDGTNSANGSPQHKVLQKCSSSHSSNSSGKSSSSGRTSSTSSPKSSSPLKLIQPGSLSPLQEAQNSITLQVSTNLSPITQEQRLPSVQSSVTLASSASNTTTISGSPGTKIYVQQSNSPMRSVITFENGSSTTSSTANTSPTNAKSSNADKEEIKSPDAPLLERQNGVSCKTEQQKMVERPSSLYGSGKDDKENKFRQAEEELAGNKLKLTNNKLNNSQAHLMDSSGKLMDSCNSRKLSLSLSKDALSYRNLLHGGGRHQPGSKCNLGSSNPPSPTKSYDNFGGSFNNVMFIENQLEGSSRRRSAQGSEPSLDLKSCTSARDELYSYPSLSDLQLQFTSLAAQKILKGCPLNSVDTLVEVNMAAQDKPNNCDVTVHTDFGLV